MAAAPIPLAELFDPDFLASVQRLRISARRVARGGRYAEQRSRDLGHGIEFRDYRPYAPGDDLRAVDWNIYRRLGRVFLRLFEELEDLPLYLLPDVSASLFLEQPPRAVGGHRDMVLLVRRGRQTVDAGGGCKLLVLRCQCRGRHLGDHESGVDPRLGHQERRQGRDIGIHQHGGPPF